MVDLSDVPLWLIFPISLVFLLGAVEVGRRIGQITRVQRYENLGILMGALFGLLALLMSFTFAWSLSRFEDRRDAILEEATAIHTTALRARLLPAPYAGDSVKLLRDYVQLRLDIIQTRREMQAAIDRSNAIQGALWQQVMAVAAKNNSVVPTGIYIQALNNMIEAQEKLLSAARSDVPDVVVLSLYGFAIFSLGFLGYITWADDRSSRMSDYLVCVLVATVLLLIQELERPSTGFIPISRQSVIDTATSIAQYGAQ